MNDHIQASHWFILNNHRDPARITGLRMKISYHLLFQGILSGLSAKFTASTLLIYRLFLIHSNDISLTAYLIYVDKIKVRNHWVSIICPQSRILNN
jgi:hypothetical protein